MKPSPKWQRLLATDLDGTVLGNELGETQFHAWAAAHPEVCLAYITGRQVESVLDLIDSGRIPQPHYVFPSVGSALLDCSDPANQLGARYAQMAGPHWNKSALIAASIGEGVADQAQSGRQIDHHAAFAWDGRPESLVGLQERLRDYSDIVVVASHGAYIDILPASLGKGAAVKFLLSQLELDPRQVLLAGDSENDLALLDSGFSAILPANACPELRRHWNSQNFYVSALTSGLGLVDGLHHIWE